MQTFEVIVTNHHHVPFLSIEVDAETAEFAQQCAEQSRRATGMHSKGDVYSAVELLDECDEQAALEFAVESLCLLSPGFAARVHEIAGACAP